MKYAEILLEKVSSFKSGYLDLEDVEAYCTAIPEDIDTRTKVVRDFTRFAIEVRHSNEFSEAALALLLEVIWFFWDYNPYSEGDPERKEIVSELWNVCSAFNLSQYPDDSIDDRLFSLKVQKYDLFQISEPMPIPDQKRRIEIRRRILTGKILVMPPNDEWYI